MVLKLSDIIFCDFNNAVWQNVWSQIIINIEACQQSQSDCDACYNELCGVITK